MPTVKFRGLVLPRSFEFGLVRFPARWPAPEIGQTITFDFSVTKGEIEVNCELDRFDPMEINSLYVRAFDLVRTAVDLTVLSDGIFKTAVLEEAVFPNGAITFMPPPKRPSGQLCTAFRATDASSFLDVFRLVTKEPAIFMALNDLVAGSFVPQQGITNSGRVADSIRNFIAPGIDRAQAWPIVQNALKADEAYIRLVTDSSVPWRHGERVYVDGPATDEIIKRAWTLFNRFLELKKRAVAELPESEFPILRG